MNLTITDDELAGLPQELLDQLKLKAKSKKTKSAPVLLTDEEFSKIRATSLEKWAHSRAIESAVLLKNNLGV